MRDARCDIIALYFLFEFPIEIIYNKNMNSTFNMLFLDFVYLHSALEYFWKQASDLIETFKGIIEPFEKNEE